MGIDHVNVPVRDLDASRIFYTPAPAPFGYKLVYDGPGSLGFGRGDGGDDDEPFAVRSGDGPNLGSHIAFSAENRAQVDESTPPQSPPGGATTVLPASGLTAGITTRPSSSIPTATTSRPSTTGHANEASRAP